MILTNLAILGIVIFALGGAAVAYFDMKGSHHGQPPEV